MMRQGKHRILIGDVLGGLRSMQDGCVRCCVTSPPYWGLRDYGVEGQIGLESTPEAYIERMVGVFREVRRVLTDDGTLFLNIGDSYARQGGSDPTGSSDGATGRGEAARGCCTPPAGLKPKDLVGIPWMLAFALRADGWYLRSDIIWHKPNPMPESVTDRPTKAHEYVFLLSKSARYFYDAKAVAERATSDGPRVDKDHLVVVGDPRDAGVYHGRCGQSDDGTRNARTVWTIATQPYSEAHFATYPEAIPERCVKAGSSERGKCPACGAAWVRKVELVGGRTTGRTAERQAAADRAGKPNGASYGSGLRPEDIAVSRTIGWEPTCTHGHDPIPDTVLDPFAGSGTTLLVACRLGRNAIGCELNPEYAEMAERRIGSGLRPATFRDESVVGGDGLFARAVHDA